MLYKGECFFFICANLCYIVLALQTQVSCITNTDTNKSSLPYNTELQILQDANRQTFIIHCKSLMT